MTVEVKESPGLDGKAITGMGTQEGGARSNEIKHSHQCSLSEFEFCMGHPNGDVQEAVGCGLIAQSRSSG